MSEESLILTRRSLTCRLLRDVAVTTGARTFRCGRNYQEKQRLPLVEQKLRNCFVLHIFFISNSRGLRQANIHLPKSHVESFVLCVREEMASEVFVKIKKNKMLVPAATSNLHFCSSYFNCCLKLIPLVAMRHTRV